MKTSMKVILRQKHFPLNANVNDEIIASEELSEWPTLSKLQYCEVMLEGQEEPVVAQKDSGAEISLIHQDLIKDRDVPTLGIINIRARMHDAVLS